MAVKTSTNNYLSAANNLGIDGGAITIEGWIRTASTPANDEFRSPFGQSSAGTSTTYRIYYRKDGTNPVAFQFSRSRTGVADQAFDYVITLEVNRWYHLALTYDGTTVRGYLDGDEVGSVAASGTGTGGTSRVIIGARAESIATYWDGDIDEVRFWDIAQSQVALKALRFRRVAGNEPNLVGYYRTDEGTSSTANDMKQAVNMSWTGAPSWVGSAPISYPA